MPPLQAKVNLGAMAKRYSTLPKAPALLEPHHNDWTQASSSQPTSAKKNSELKPVVICLILALYHILSIIESLVLWHISHYRLFNAKSSLYIYISFTNHILKLNSSKYCYSFVYTVKYQTVLFQTIQSYLSQLFALSLNVNRF